MGQAHFHGCVVDRPAVWPQDDELHRRALGALEHRDWFVDEHLAWGHQGGRRGELAEVPNAFLEAVLDDELRRSLVQNKRERRCILMLDASGGLKVV
jgi:hypothetical protein